MIDAQPPRSWTAKELHVVQLVEELLLELSCEPEDLTKPRHQRLVLSWASTFEKITFWGFLPFLSSTLRKYAT